MGPRRVASRADVADRLALGDRLAIVDGDPALVAVQRAEPAAMADHHRVAVPTHPRGRDDRPRLGGVDRHPDWTADVDAGVQTAPPHAEARRDRPADRPDEARRRDRPGVGALLGADQRREVGLVALDRIRFGDESGDALVEGVAQPRLLALGYL